MSQRTERRLVKIEKELDVIVWHCDGCGIEMTTSRDLYFGDERLIVEGEDKTWLRVWNRPAKVDYPTSGESFDFCSAECVSNWVARIKVAG